MGERIFESWRSRKSVKHCYYCGTAKPHLQAFVGVLICEDCFDVFEFLGHPAGEDDLT